MSWLEKLLPSKIQQTDPTERRQVPEGLWIKCPSCETVLYKADLEQNQNVCPKCSHHHRIGARARLDAFLDAEGRYEIGQEVLPVDALAIAIGTSHGAYKFTKPPTGDVLAIDRIKEIHKRIPNTHLVMHGSSSVPQEWLKIINEYGGDIKETYGVPVEEIVEGIKHGVRKVNIDTDLRLASTGAMRRLMATNPSEFDPRKFFGATVTAMRDVCIARYEAFGTAGNASKIKPISLEAMYQRYLKGELNAKVN